MTCRHCWSEQHLIEHCPDVVAAFVNEGPARNHRAEPHAPLICPECGVEFKRKWPLQKYCSKPCYKTANLRQTSERWAQTDNGKKAQARRCQKCGCSLWTAPRATKYCSHCRSAVYAQHARERSRRVHAARKAAQ